MMGSSGGDVRRADPDGDGPDDGTDRRTFVKGMVVGAAAAAAGVAGYALWPKVPQGDGSQVGDKVPYYGAEVQVGSPTDHGVPNLPITVDREGYILSTVDDLTPYTYCRTRHDWQALSDTTGTDRWLRYHVPRHRLEQVEADEDRSPQDIWWYHDRIGDRIHVDDFADRPPKTGAGFAFRARPGEQDPFQGVVVKYDPETIKIPQELRTEWADMALADHHLVAYDAACTHFCCTAGWQESATAEELGAWDLIFCTCHHARFDPFVVKKYEFRLVHDRTWHESTVHKASMGPR